MKLAYISDIEGRWEKLEGFCADNPLLELKQDQLILKEGTILVFGGDAIDRGPAGRRLLKCLVDAKDTYGTRVILLAGNRDINKLRLPRELNGHPRNGAPQGSKADILRWTLLKTMGAAEAFQHRATELGTENTATIADSFGEDVQANGLLLKFLQRAQLGYRWQNTLFVHGAVGPESLFAVPEQPKMTDIDAWLDALNHFYDTQLLAYQASPLGQDHAALVAYQAPLPGSRANPQSVVYGRPVTPDGSPILPEISVQKALLDQGINRIVVGHTPSGDCPSPVQREDGRFLLVAADNSYGKLERGSQVLLSEHETFLRGWSQPRHEGPQRVMAQLTEGHRQRIGHYQGEALIKGQLPDGRLLAGRMLPGFICEEFGIS